VCTKERGEVFGKVENEKMTLNEYGKIIENIWVSLPLHHNVKLDVYQVMPDHFHGIIILRKNIVDDVCRGIACNAPTACVKISRTNFGHVVAGSLGCVIRSFKSECTKQIGKLEGKKMKLWQRSYYDHVIRNEKDLIRIRTYIRENPKNY
jgi:REP element-mobilizing transposase RayT